MPAPTMNTAPLTISFTDTSSGDGLSYLWNFGDGSTSQQRNPTHTFQAGVWEVKLTVSNGNGTDVASSTIVALPNQADSAGESNSNAGAAARDAATGNQNNQQQQQQNMNDFGANNRGFNAGSGAPNLDF